MYEELIVSFLEESISVKRSIRETLVDQIALAAEKISLCLNNKKKILIFGNGGSAADAQHIAAELVGRYKKERRAMPALALTTNTSILTAVGNDYSFDEIFVRQIEALAEKGDILWGISTSGNSPNVVKAIEKGKEMGIYSIALLGRGGGKVKDICDLPIIIPSDDTARIQEAHITIAHIICEVVEKEKS